MAERVDKLSLKYMEKDNECENLKSELQQMKDVFD